VVKKQTVFIILHYKNGLENLNVYVVAEVLDGIIGKNYLISI